MAGTTLRMNAAVALAIASTVGFVAHSRAGASPHVPRTLTWLASSRVHLERPVLVRAGDTLRIEAGAHVAAAPGTSIRIGRGGVILAEGTATRPIVFDCAGARSPGCWDGITIHGQAPINHGTPGAGDCYEAVLEAQRYGGCDATSSSGVLRYVVVRNAWRGVRLLGAGRGTRVEHLAVLETVGDGLTVRGGTVDLRHVFLRRNRGSGLRYEGGWAGRAQFILIAQDSLRHQAGVVGSSVPGTSPSGSRPRLFNVTVWNPPAAGDPDDAAALRLERGATGELRNWLLLESAAALDIDDAATCESLRSGALDVGPVLVATQGLSGAADPDPSACAESAAGNTELAVLRARADNVFVSDAATLAALTPGPAGPVPDFRPGRGAPVPATRTNPADDGFFDSGSNYFGAVPADDSTIPWYGWIAAPPAASAGRAAPQVTIAPGTATLAPGDTVRLAVTVRDADGVLLAQAPTTWRTTNAGIASVAADGTLSAVSGGTAIVIASSGLAVATAVVRVTEPPPPATTDARWPNEPPGATVTVDIPSFSLPLPNQRAGNWQYNSSFAENVNASSGVLRFNFPQGFRGGAGPGRAVINDVNDQQYQNYYVGVRVRFSRPWQRHPVTDKIVYFGEMTIRDENPGAQAGQAYCGRVEDGLVGCTVQAWQGGAEVCPLPYDSARNFPCGPNEPRLARTRIDDGNWHLMEIVARGSTGGQPNGGLTVFVDGVRQWASNNVRWTPRDRTRFYGINLDPVWGGGSGVSKAQTDWMELGSLRVSGF